MGHHHSKEVKEKTVALLESMPTGDTTLVEKYVSDKHYKQHNPMAEDGKDFFRKFVETKMIKSCKVVRILHDGDYVVTHMDYDCFGPKVAFDVIRFEHGQAVEHWDILQDKAGPNPSGRTMLDGPTEIEDHSKTAANKALIEKYADEILINRRMENAANYYDGDFYIQHNPMVGDGLSGISKALEEWTKQGITMTYDKVHKVLGEGNFVLAMSEGQMAGKHTAFYDLFRIENGKIAEHWDIIEEIPGKEHWKNPNGKF